MKQLLGCFGIIVCVVLGAVYAFDRVVEKTPLPLRESSASLFSTPEKALETWLYARNERDYTLYLEALGKSGTIEISADTQYDMDLWGRILDYEITRRTRFEDLVIIQLKQDFQAPNANIFPGQLEDYYFHFRGDRWVYLPPGLERTIVWIKSVIWNVVS